MLVDKNLENWNLGASEFNKGNFFEAHKFWEELWIRSEDPEKTYIQGVIMLCGVLLHIKKEKLGSAKTLALKCQKKITNSNLFEYRIQGLEDFLKLVSEELWSQVRVEMTKLKACGVKA